MESIVIPEVIILRWSGGRQSKWERPCSTTWILFMCIAVWETWACPRVSRFSSAGSMSAPFSSTC